MSIRKLVKAQHTIIRDTVKERIQPFVQSFKRMETMLDQIQQQAKIPSAKITMPSEKAPVKIQTNSKAPQAIKTNIIQTSNITYAQALASAKTPIEAIRNPQIVGSDDQCERVITQLKKDDACSNAKIISIREKGKSNYTIKCADSDSADKVGGHLKKKYHNATKITAVTEMKPKIKITKIFTDTPHTDEIREQLKEQNQWLTNKNFEIEHLYEVTNAKTAYKNAIICCDLKLHPSQEVS